MKTRDIKMLAVGFAAGALSVGAIIGAGTAHADPNSFYFECLNQHGWSVSNTANALDVGVRVENDLKRGVPNDQIEYNLIHYFGTTPEEASVITTCALATYLS